MDKTVIETLWDPSGRKGGREGCFQARLQGNHAIWGAGTTQREAVEDTILTAATLGYSGRWDDYVVILVEPYPPDLRTEGYPP